MTTYENLLDHACESDIKVIENYNLSGTQLKGLYCNSTVAIGDNTVSDSERTCILAEELGHHYTAIGNILDQSSVENRKQEMRGRLWAYNKLIGLHGIISCYRAGCHSSYEMAEYLGVTEEFICEALECYHRKYGIYATCDNYVVYFEPHLLVLELV